MVTEQDAERIVNYVAASATRSAPVTQTYGSRLSTAAIEPILLSLVCSGLNAERLAVKAKGMSGKGDTLDTEDLAKRGGEIIEHFYDERIRDMPPAISRLIENELITTDGIRRQYPMQSALVYGRVSAAQIDHLVEQRILRIESVNDGQRIELVHDQLAAVALKRRQEALLRETADQLRRDQAIAAGRLKRNTFVGSVIVVVLAVIAVTMFVLWRRAVESQQVATTLRLAAEGQAIVSQSLPENPLRGPLEVLASHRIGSGWGPYSALQSLSKLLSRMEHLIENPKPINTVAFSPDGKRIVSGSADNTLRLWEAESGKPIGEPLRGHGVAVLSVAFSPDGKRIVSGSADNTLRLWSVLNAWADELCAELPRNMSRDEWKKWVGEIPYRRQCQNLPGPPNEESLATLILRFFDN